MTYLTAVGWRGPRWIDLPPPLARQRQRARREPRKRRSLRRVSGTDDSEAMLSICMVKKVDPRLRERL